MKETNEECLIKLKKQIEAAKELVELGVYEQGGLYYIENEYRKCKKKIALDNHKCNRENETEKKRQEERNQSLKEKRIKNLNSIVERIEKFEKNERLMKIILNFLEQNEVKDIELYAIPKRRNGEYLYPDYYLDEIESFDKIKYTLLAAYNKRKSVKDILEGYQLKNSSLEEVEKLFNALVGQRYIHIKDKQAFYFFISEKEREKKIALYNDLSLQYAVSRFDSDEFIVKKLYSQNVNKNEIDIFLALSHYANFNNRLFSDCLRDAQDFAKKIFESLAQKKYLERLFNGEKKLGSIEEVDLMTGVEFEKFVAKLFERMGYESEVTKSSGDQGIDVLAKKGNILIAIQAKCYNVVVGNHAIMEAVAGKNFYRADKCMVVTNSIFTKSAKELADANDVILWDRQVLKEKIGEI